MTETYMVSNAVSFSITKAAISAGTPLAMARNRTDSGAPSRTAAALITGRRL